MKSVVIVGASGAIGHAFVNYYSEHFGLRGQVYAFSSTPGNSEGNVKQLFIDYQCEDSIRDAANYIETNAQGVDMVIVATGKLHDHQSSLFPEKALKEISGDYMRWIFENNVVVPALLAKHFLRTLTKKRPSIFAVLSARVGSISDNHLGGWYAYRSSKAALNMLIRCSAIEMARSHKQAAVIGLHPGTVRSSLSEPFLENIPTEQLLEPEESVAMLAKVLEGIGAKDSGSCFDYRGQVIAP